MIANSVAAKLKETLSPFAQVWALWQVTNVLTAQYEIFRLT